MDVLLRLKMAILVVIIPIGGFGVTACGSSSPATIPHSVAAVEVWVKASATVPAVASLRKMLREMPEIVSCAYLDRQASDEELKELEASHPLDSVVFGILTPTTTPTLFICQLSHIGDLGKVEKRVARLADVFEVTASRPPS